MIQTPAEKIRQRRSQMLVHSFLYYGMDDSIVSDEQWQRWADELSALQREHPGDIGFYDKEFADWDGSTGMHLPHDEWTREKALQVRNVWARTLRPGATDSTPPAPQIAAPAAIAAPLPAQASLF